MINRSLRTAAVAAAVTAFTLVSAVSGGGVKASADAGPAAGKSLVVFGDSFTANAYKPGQGLKECVHGETSWPAQLSRLMAVDADDVENDSCIGASIDSGPVSASGKHFGMREGYVLTQQAHKAVDAKAFGPRTRVVAIQMGANDAWPQDGPINLAPALNECVLNLIDGCGLDAIDQGRFPDYRRVSGQAYADRVRGVIEYVRYYAPNAQILLVGYPELYPHDQDWLCMDVLGIGQYFQPRGRAMVEYLNSLEAAQRDAATALQIGFIDAWPLTAGHGMCSTQPWINGLGDWRADLLGLPFHPSVQGDKVMAAAIYGRISHH